MKKRLIALMLAVSVVFTGCASIERFSKDVTSDITGGLNRTVEVYDYSGHLLKTYTGKIDIATSESGNKIKFDVNGERYLIYNAIVIVEENNKNEPLYSITDN